MRPVESGVRLAVVGWVQSRVRSAEQRELLFELAQATDEAAEEIGKTEDKGSDPGSPTFAAVTRLKHVRNNLIRLWSES